MHRGSAQIYLRATVQDGVLMMHSQLLFFAAKVQIWPLLSIHTLKSVVQYVSNVQSQLLKWLDTKLNIPIPIKTPRYKDGVVLTLQKIHRI